MEEQKLATLESKFSGSGSSNATKRIISAYRGFLNKPEYSINFLNDSEVENLKADFERLVKMTGKPKEIVYEIRFPQNFPASPPFIRVIWPRFVFRTGHVTIGGSICVQTLTPSAWNANFDLENIMMEIINSLDLGGGRINLTDFREYTLSEAQEAFTRVARFHGWIN